MGVTRVPVRPEAAAGAPGDAGPGPDTDAAPPVELPGWIPSAIRNPLSDLATRLRAVETFERHALTRATKAVPRTLRFVTRALFSGEVDGGLRRPAISVGFAAQVAIDEALLAVAMTPGRFPHRSDYSRVADELADARAMYVRRGWLARPGSYHREPPPLTDADVTWSRHSAMGTPYERITFESGFTPRTGEPGSERWASFAPNATAVATVLRHPGPPRPWIVAVHGFCMGFPTADFRGLQTEMLHHELGYNVVMPVLPLHGMRRVTRISGEPFLSFELMNAVHGLTQSVWDIRRIIGWLRGQGAPAVSVYGVSLGGYVASLLAGIEPGFDRVVAGIPVSDLPALFHAHSPHDIRAHAVEHKVLGGPAEDVFRVVSPFSFTPDVPVERRFVYGGLGDRLSTALQARRLWEHWGEPEICWYPGNHVGYLWSGHVREFLRGAFEEPAEGALPIGA